MSEGRWQTQTVSTSGPIARARAWPTCAGWPPTASACRWPKRVQGGRLRGQITC